MKQIIYKGKIYVRIRDIYDKLGELEHLDVATARRILLVEAEYNCTRMNEGSTGNPHPFDNSACAGEEVVAPGDMVIVDEPASDREVQYD